MNESWQEVQVIIHYEAQEALSEILTNIGAQGIAIEGDILIKEARENKWGDYFPEPYSFQADHVSVKAYFYDQKTESELLDLAATARGLKEFGLEVGDVQVTARIVHEQDWATAWKAYYHTTIIDKVVVQPSWESYTPASDQIHVILDPGMAFGTGTHPTTSMCIQALQKIPVENKKVWDIGTGSGLLAIVAAKLGAGAVKAVDTDPVAVKVANENSEINQVQLTALQGSLELLTEQADIIIANIIADVIIDLLPQVKEKLVLGGIFIASGIIQSRSSEVLKAAQAIGLSVEFEQTDGEWVCYCFKLGASSHD